MACVLLTKGVPKGEDHDQVLRWMRLGVQGGYRITSGLGHIGYTESDINGFTLGGTLQFGSL